jgi:hypothetical protein
MVLLNTGLDAISFLAIVSLIPHDVLYGPQARTDCRKLCGAIALQRLLARLSRLRHRGRPGAVVINRRQDSVLDLQS